MEEVRGLPAQLPPHEQIVSSLSSGDETDAALGIVAAWVSIVPFIGGPGAAALGEWRKARTDRRYAEMLADVLYALAEVRDKVDMALVHTREHAELVEATVEEGTRGRQKAKRDYYVNGIVNASIEGHGSIDEAALFMATLDRMQIPHLRLLRVLEGLPSSGKDGRFYVQSGAEERQAIVGGMGDLAPEIVQVLLDELGRFGLADSREVMADGGLVPEDRDHVLTEYGRRFVAFVREPRNEQAMQ